MPWEYRETLLQLKGRREHTLFVLGKMMDENFVAIPTDQTGASDNLLKIVCCSCKNTLPASKTN